MVSGGSGAQRHLLATIVAGLHDPHIAAIRIGRSPRGFGHHGKTWLYATERGRGLQLTRAVWQLDVVSGLFADECRARGLRRLAGTSRYVLLRDGRRQYAGADSVVTGPVSSAAPGRLESLIRAGAKRARLAVTSRSFDRFIGGRSAVSIVVRVPNDRPALGSVRARTGTLVEALVSPQRGLPLAEGVFVTVREPSGRWVFAAGYAPRAQTGLSTWP